MTPVRTLIAALTDLLLPTTCGGCGAGCDAGHGWCPACDDGSDAPHAVRSAPPPVGPVIAAGRYRGPLRRALLGYKERGRRDLAPALARLLVPAVAAVLPVSPRGPVWLVPVPSRPSAARARGGDHVLRLCRELAARLVASGLDARVAPALALDRRARDSVGLDPAQRAANRAGAVRVAGGSRVPRPVGGLVLLVDDVITTGVTLEACAAALDAAGTTVHAAVVLCDATGGRGPERCPGPGPRPHRTEAGVHVGTTARPHPAGR